MVKPLIHPASDHILSLLMKNLPQSLLITGPEGIGLSAVSRYVAESISKIFITVLPEKDEKVDIEKGTINVASIRKLYDQTRTKSVGNRIILIDYAERMTVQAQNAFLKLLEEPGVGTYFILATHTPTRLLPTVASRVQSIELIPLNAGQTEAFINTLNVTDIHIRAQLLFMADGLPAELSRLTQNSVYFDAKVAIVRDARELLQGSTYKKLLIAQKYKDDREATLGLLTAASNILRQSITAKPQESLIGQIDGLLVAYQKVKANGNIRLCLARFVIQ
jgi:DNA polymerase-3 subunit delta'